MLLKLALQLGSVFVWTYGYSLLRSASQLHEERELENGLDEKIPNVDCLNAGETSKLLTTVQIIPEEPSSGGDYLSDKQSASTTVRISFPFKNFIQEIGIGNLNCLCDGLSLFWHLLKSS